MKKLFLLPLLLTLMIFSCKDSEDDEPQKDWLELITGQWIRENSACENAGYTINADGTWKYGAFDGCSNNCGVFPFGGTYSFVSGKLSFTGGPGESDNLRGRVELTEKVLEIYDEDTGVLISRYLRFAGCQS